MINREIYYKKWAHTIMKADKSKICSKSQQTEEFDGVVLGGRPAGLRSKKNHVSI